MADSLQRRREAIPKALKDQAEPYFLMFLEVNLGVPRIALQGAVRQAPLSEDAMYDAYQTYYTRGKEECIRSLGLVQDIPQPYPDSLPPRIVYRLIDTLNHTGQSTLRYARTQLRTPISEKEFMLARQGLSESQKESLFDIGIRQLEARSHTPATDQVLENMLNENFGGTRRKLLELDQKPFLRFCKEAMGVSEDTIRTAMLHAEPAEEAKQHHLQKSYKKDKKDFVQRHSSQLPNLLHNVHPNVPFPDSLNELDTYPMVDAQKSTGQSWLRYARMDLGVTISSLEAMIIRNVLTPIQKDALLDIGISERQARGETPNEVLETFYMEWLGKKAF